MRKKVLSRDELHRRTILKNLAKVRNLYLITIFITQKTSFCAILVVICDHIFLNKPSFQAVEISVYGALKAQIKGVANQGVSDAHLVEPWYLPVEIGEIFKTKVVAGI